MPSRFTPDQPHASASGPASFSNLPRACARPNPVPDKSAPCLRVLGQIHTGNFFRNFSRTVAARPESMESAAISIASRGSLARPPASNTAAAFTDRDVPPCARVPGQNGLDHRCVFHRISARQLVKRRPANSEILGAHARFSTRPVHTS